MSCSFLIIPFIVELIAVIVGIFSFWVYLLL